MKKYQPPFQITPKILQLLQSISKEIGILEGRKLEDIPLSLRRSNNIKTIQASLAIEGNTLTLEQVTDILEKKRVLGPLKDILEVKNAFQVYHNLQEFNPLDMSDFLKAHAILMEHLVEEKGKWRTTGVGIMKGNIVSHIAPSAKRVPELMGDLFEYIKTADLPWLLKACIFHYELEFIHPFQDGNGRMGRLWQQVLLLKEHPIFSYVPVEVLIKEQQSDYYKVLGESDQAGESTVFIEFSLRCIFDALADFSQGIVGIKSTPSSRLNFAKSRLIKKWFNRQDYMKVHPDISTATASRDLAFGVSHQLLRSKGEQNQTRYRFQENTE